MATKKARKPKIQRGVSLDPDLFARISVTASRLGMPWNTVVEAALGRAFPDGHEMPTSQEKRKAQQPSDELVQLK